MSFICSSYLKINFSFYFLVLGNKIKRPKADKDTNNTKHRSKKNDRVSESDNLVESSTNAHEMELESMIQNLTSLHNEMCLKTDDRLETAETLIQKFCSTVDQQLVRIIDWAKQLPGYCNLSISDQAILLQAAWVDLLVLNWVYQSLHVSEKIRLSMVFSLSLQEAKSFGFDEIYLYLHSLVSRAKKYNIDVEEISCLKAINLTNAGECLFTLLIIILNEIVVSCSVGRRSAVVKRVEHILIIVSVNT